MTAGSRPDGAPEGADSHRDSSETAAPAAGPDAGASEDTSPVDAGSTWHLDPGLPLSAKPCSFAQRQHALAPTTLWAPSLKAPRPTNAFWMNLVLDGGDQRVNALPYHVKAIDGGLAIAFPRSVVAADSITTPADVHWILGASEPLDGHRVTRYDDLSVTVTSTSSTGSIEAPIVYGMPYVSALYDGLTPRLRVGAGAAISMVNGTAGPSSVTAERLTVALNNGQTWTIYAPSPLTWSWTAAGLQAMGALHGWIRIAHRADAAAGALLDQFAGAIPTGGTVDLATSGDTGLVRFDWQRTGRGRLLMMAMPHHLARLDSPLVRPLTVATLRGPLTAIEGDTWTLRYPLSTTGWTANRPIDPAVLPEIQAALSAEAGYVPPEQADPYFGGKQLARVARLALIAREIGATQLAQTFTSTLRTATAPWLEGKNPNPFVYDTTWGGIVTTKGISDPSRDFGQGYYNDHHFHYGYHVYAAATLASDEQPIPASAEDQTLCLVRDIANPSNADPYFPRVRNFDWFEGHSWASGLFSFGDGRNQESTSEAVNAWYAVELYGRARHHQTLTNLGRILRAMETASAQTYWQVTDNSSVYPPPFKDHHGVGILWSTKIDFSTFFGAAPAFIYGIQMLPFTPATEDLLAKAWITDAGPQLAAAAVSADPPWKGLMYMARAIVDRDGALAQVRSLTGYDDGNSRANTLYWVATRPR